MVNFKKCKLLASCFGDLCKFQAHPYTFVIDPSLTHYLSLEVSHVSENELYALSKKLEPPGEAN
jgi:hypothetical protein